MEARGALVVLGTGITAGQHLTREAVDELQAADVVWFLVADAVMSELIQRHNSNAHSLSGIYAEAAMRQRAYARIAGLLCEEVRAGQRVAAAFYGHPGVFCTPGHEAIRLVRSDGYPARMLPGVSAEDCLIADLGIDPGFRGFQSWEATDFLRRTPPVDTKAMTALWQVGVVGRCDLVTYSDSAPRAADLDELLMLARFTWGEDRHVFLYEASPYPGVAPTVKEARLSELGSLEIAPMATLVVTPAKSV